MYVVMYCLVSRSQATHLHCQKLGVSVRDVNLSEGKTIHWVLVERRLQICLIVFQRQAAGSTEDGYAVTRSSCWKAIVDRDFLHQLYNFLCETTLLPFHIPFRIPAFRLSQLPCFGFESMNRHLQKHTHETRNVLPQLIHNFNMWQMLLLVGKRIEASEN